MPSKTNTMEFFCGLFLSYCFVWLFFFLFVFHVYVLFQILCFQQVCVNVYYKLLVFFLFLLLLMMMLFLKRQGKGHAIIIREVSSSSWWVHAETHSQTLHRAQETLWKGRRKNCRSEKDTNEATPEPSWVCTGSFIYMLWFLAPSIIRKFQMKIKCAEQQRLLAEPICSPQNGRKSSPVIPQKKVLICKEIYKEM